VTQTKLLVGLLLVALAIAIAYTAITAYAVSYKADANKTSHKTPPKPHPLYVTTRTLKINGSRILAELNVDVVNENVTHVYGRVIYGTGTITLGNETFVIKTVYGTLNGREAKLTLYAGNALIELHVRGHRYFAVVKHFGQSEAKIFAGRAEVKVQ